MSMTAEKNPSGTPKPSAVKSNRESHETIPAFEVHERCDRYSCPAAAKVRVDIINGHRLYFCGHHYNELAIDLLIQTHVLFDERDWKPEDPDSGFRRKVTMIQEPIAAAH